ncbi:recombinase family protein [Alkalicoccobacillus gibsonii]|uniref:Recombinase family protein n=1 Tax=Alkalicoccobacillus gibsonii TaxID=79881 RepID=A0ABU9VI57_9BACI
MDNRTWALYRVSTAGQVNSDEDIPMQRNACERYATQQGWTISKEVFERGVSGWKKSADQRDELVLLKEAALKNQFDNLIVYHSDRLGRKSEESPFVLKFLHDNHVAVHSASEGHLRSENHVDALLNYIRYWNNEGESLKTSMRVTEEMQRLRQQDFYVGGQTPFGFSVVETNQKHWKKDKKLKILLPHILQGKVVSMIYELSAYKNYGSARTAAVLNEMEITNQFGRNFTDKFIGRILDNPLYSGRRPYTKILPDGTRVPALQSYNPNHDIIGKELKSLSDKRRNSRKGASLGVDQADTGEANPSPMSSKVLLSGIIFCGYCGSKLTTDYSYKDYKRKTDRNTTRMICYRYICKRGKEKKVPHEKKQVGCKKLDEQVEEYVLNYMSNLDLSLMIKDIKQTRSKTLTNLNQQIKTVEKQLSKKEVELKRLKEEVTKVLLGESVFTPELLQEAITGTTASIEHLKNKKLTLAEKYEADHSKIDEIRSIQDVVNGWPERYKKAPLDIKKIMLSDVVERVVYKKDDIDIRINLLDSFI